MPFSLPQLAKLIDLAITKKPPSVISDLAGDYYSPYYYLMYLLTWTQCGGVCVELGVEGGRGCGSLAAGSKNARVYGFDTARAEPRLSRTLEQFPNFVFHQQPSLPPDPAKFYNQPLLMATYDKPIISVLHIDTEHSYAMAQAEFMAYLRYLRPGAAVLFDDLHAQNDGVMKFFMELPYPKIQEDRLHPTCGYGVLLITQDEEDD